MSKDINYTIKKEFPEFKVVDQDDNFLYMRDGKIGRSNVIEARINRGSLGDFNVRFVIEKRGCRSRIFGGNDPDKAIKRIKLYLKKRDC